MIFFVLQIVAINPIDICPQIIQLLPHKYQMNPSNEKLFL